MEVSELSKQVEALHKSAQTQASFSSPGGDRNIGPLAGILKKLIQELGKSDPDQRRLHRLVIESQDHWGNMARAVLRDQTAGIEIASDELHLVTESKSLVDELVQKAEERFRTQRSRSTDRPDPHVDTKPAAEEDAVMTDLTRQEVDAKLAQNKAEVDARLANFDASIKTGFSELRAEFAEMRAEMAKQSGDMRAEMANVRADSSKATTEVTRWVVGFGITILGTMLAIFGAVVTYSKMSGKPETASSQAAAPGTVVVAVPAGSTILSAPQAPATAQPPAK